MSKIKIEIKSCLDNKILFTHEKEDNTVRDTLVKAVESGANLHGADLIGAKLYGADLICANLRGANLIGAKLSTANLRGANLRHANLRHANLRYANLHDAFLCDANLRGADLIGANLRGTDLRDADLYGARLEPIKKDFFDVLLRAIPEIDNLKNAIINGKIDGSTYEGECACLCGTLEKSKSEKISNAIFELRDFQRPIEIFFRGIRLGDNPENNEFSKIVLEWIEEFESYLNRGK